MSGDSATSAQRIVLRYGLRSLLFAVAFTAIYFCLLKSETFRVYGYYGFGGNYAFWVTLLSPLWIPSLYARDWSAKRRARNMLVLPAIIWYFLLDVLAMYVATADVVAGSLVALVALALALPGRWKLVVVPLWVSILVGTISVVLR